MTAGRPRTTDAAESHDARASEVDVPIDEDVPLVASEPQLPERLGDYLLTEALGSGGMGDVFKAQRVGSLAGKGSSTPLAIKRIRTHGSEAPDLAQRLRDEARITSLLDHANIVKVFAIEEVKGAVFVVMEYLDGVDLGQVLRSLRNNGRSLKAGPVAQIGAQAARGLAYAHALVDANGVPCGIVHRDISPSNLMLQRNGCVKLVDFGVATAAAYLRAAKTVPGVLRGKPSYFSPEQAKGQALDGRSDVYSLAVTLWELLTGRRLFSGPRTLEHTRAFLERPVERPSLFRPGIPPEMDRIILRALEKDRALRYQSAAELAAELETFAQSVPGRGDVLPHIVRSIDREKLGGIHLLRRGPRSVSAHARAFDQPASEPAPRYELPRGRPRPVAAPPPAASAPPPPPNPAPAHPVSQAPAGASPAARDPSAAARRWRGEHPRGGRLALVLVSLLSLTALAAVYRSGAMSRSPRPTRTSGAAAAPAREVVTVQVEIRSEPRGAAVSSSSGALGTTPLLLTRPRSDAQETLQLAKPGFEAATVQVHLERDGIIQVALTKAPSSPRRRPAAEAKADVRRKAAPAGKPGQPFWKRPAAPAASWRFNR